jgi:DNA-binding Lrp family transcriptional regulator
MLGWWYRLKDVELKILCELMKNSRRSDRELANAVGVSQPTISRTIKKLEKEGYIREYTIVPDFKKLGFQMMAVILSKMKPHTPEAIEQIRSKVREDESKHPSPILMGVTGMGIGSDRVTIWLSEDYSAYTDSVRMIKQHPMVDVENVNSFIINLGDENQFMPFTFSNLARYLDRKQKSQKSKA